MVKPTIYYIRHGQTDWNAELRFQGQQDIPLNALGREQARRNGERLADLLRSGEQFQFISSPMGRARETMEIIRTILGLDPHDYLVDDRLMEISFGDWEGITLPEIKSRFPDLHRRRKKERWHFSPPNGDSHEAIHGRVTQWYGEIDRPTVVTAHGVVGRVLRKHVLGLEGQVAAEFVFPQDQICCFEDRNETFL